MNVSFGSRTVLLLVFLCPPLAGQVLPDRASLERQFESRYGAGWTFEWDGETGTPTAIFGPGAPVVPSGALQKEEAESLGRSILEANRALLGAGPDEFAPLVSRQGRRLYYLVYRQVHRGLEVIDSRADIRIHLGTGRLVLLGSRALRGLDVATTPRLAEATAVSMLRGLGFVPGRDVVAGTRLVIFPVAGRGRLAWEVDAQIEEPLTHPLLYVDATSGETLDVREQIHHDFSGNVGGNGTPGILPDTATNPPVLFPLQGVTVSILGVGSAVTDASGNFTVPSISTTDQTVTVNLSGPFFNVNNYNGTSAPGPDATVTQTIPAGGSANFLFNAVPAQFATAQVNGARLTQRVHDYILGIIGAPGINTAIPVNVNRNSSCNAYFTASGSASINFYWAASSCPNTCYATIVEHEYGHFLDWAIGGITNGGISEGIGDFLATYLTGQPIIGSGFSGPGTIIRTADNTRTFPAPECINATHCMGQMWAGFCWHLRANLIASLGSAAGIALAEDVTFNSLLGNASLWRNAIREVFLQDDDDGNLSNGTPHQTAIGKAAQQHGFLSDEFSPTTFSHTPLPDTMVTTAPYPVSVVVTAKPSSGASITGVTLFVSTNDGASYSTSAMAAAGGGLYTGSIPAQAAPKAVKYYFTAANDQAYTRRFPVNAQSPFVFTVGLKTIVFADGFDAGPNGWTEALVSGTSEDWMQGPPNLLGNNDFDPTAPLSAPNVRGTNLSGDYPNSTVEELRSPIFNLSGQTGARLRYGRYLSMVANDVARVRVNGTDVYATPTTPGYGENAWATVDTSIGALADNNPSVQIVFRLESNTSTSTLSNSGGWNLDDFVLYRLEPVPPCAPPILLGAGTPGTGGIVPTLSGVGGLSQIGNGAFGLSIGSGLGGAFGVLVLNVVETSIPFAGGTIFVAPGVAIPVSLGGIPGTAGAGSLVVGLPIPFSPSLVGGMASAQAAIVDSNANSGVSLTAGLRVTICP